MVGFALDTEVTETFSVFRKSLTAAYMKRPRAGAALCTQADCHGLPVLHFGERKTPLGIVFGTFYRRHFPRINWPISLTLAAIESICFGK